MKPSTKPTMLIFTLWVPSGDTKDVPKALSRWMSNSVLEINSQMQREMPLPWPLP